MIFWAGFFLGVSSVFFLSLAIRHVRLETLRHTRCQACGRDGAILAILVDIEDGEVRQRAVICEACNQHAQGVASRSPPPWARR